MTRHQPIVEELKSILRNNPWMRPLLVQSIKDAKQPGIQTLDQYYDYVDNLATWIPTDRDLYNKIVQFYWLVDQPTGRELQRTSELFRTWLVDFAEDWGNFLNTTESARHIDTFLDDPDFHIDDYEAGPSGWMTFNQFFARQVRPGKRPVDGLCDDTVIVSPADSQFVGHWPIADDSTITVKNIKHSVKKLLHDSPYADAFDGGTFMHAFLNVNDYHRYHVPVAGTVKDVRDIMGEVYLDVYQDASGELHARDGTGYQFRQARGLIVQDSPIGLVATLPIGMAQVSSANLTPEVGDPLHKGQEFGYFLFGGSDIIVMFQAGAAEITAKPGVHHKVGVRIGTGKPRG